MKLRQWFCTYLFPVPGIENFTVVSLRVFVDEDDVLTVKYIAPGDSDLTELVVSTTLRDLEVMCQGFLSCLHKK